MNREELRDELVQVAAVAVSILEDLDYGQADSLAEAERVGPIAIHQVDVVLNDVIEERVRQDRKWGPQHHDPEDWMLILMEEVGEAANELTPIRRGIVERIRLLGLEVQVFLDTVLFPKE